MKNHTTKKECKKEAPTECAFVSGHLFLLNAWGFIGMERGGIKYAGLICGACESGLRTCSFAGCVAGCVAGNDDDHRRAENTLVGLVEVVNSMEVDLQEVGNKIYQD